MQKGIPLQGFTRNFKMTHQPSPERFPKPPPVPRVGVAVIIVRDGKVLLGKRLNAHGAGTWAFPGGHLEFNESIEGCARREVFEETGLSVKDPRYAAYTNDLFRRENKHYVTLFVTATIDAGTPWVKEPDKCETWQWFAWDSLPSPLFLSLKNLLDQGFSPLENAP